MENDMAGQLGKLHRQALAVLEKYALALEKAGAPPRFGCCSGKLKMNSVTRSQVLLAIIVANENSTQVNDLLLYISKYSKHPEVQEAARKAVEHKS
jgi:hypothetical protein